MTVVNTVKIISAILAISVTILRALLAFQAEVSSAPASENVSQNTAASLHQIFDDEWQRTLK